MTQRTTPPFRADHVGSLLRPAELAEARAKAKRGELSALMRRDHARWAAVIRKNNITAD